MNQGKYDQRGFTLIEVMMALAVSLILMGAIYAVVNSGHQS